MAKQYVAIGIAAALLTGGGMHREAGHATHLRTQIADYRIGYLPAGQRAAEYAWTAAHYDRIILDWGDAVSMPEYRRLNPATEMYRYALNWTVIQPTSASKPNIAATYYPDMLAWYAARPQYGLERAFLHRPSCGLTPACRVSFKIWKDDRWAVNPGDAGLRAYARQRLVNVASDADGLFLDEQGSGDFDPLLKGGTSEYPDRATYQRDIVSLLAEIRAALGSHKRLLINTATYITPWDAQMVRAAGGTHGEYLNNAGFAEMEARWAFAESALSSGATVDLTPPADAPNHYTPGNYASIAERTRMWELASYYLVEPATPGQLFLNVNGSAWKQPYTATWLPAIDADVGRPTASRRQIANGTDPKGNAYRIWGRDYSRALVLVRPVTSWSAQAFGDETLVNVPLPPGGEYHVLRADGSMGPAVRTIGLRNSEAVILMKQGRSGGY